MAGGPHHYREAERLIADAPMVPGAGDAAVIALAQVHAQLAIAAAAALGPHLLADLKAWREVAGTQPAPPAGGMS